MALQEPTTLPLFEEMMGRSTAPQAITPAAAASRTSVKPTPSGSARRRSNPLKGTIILNNNNNVNIEGVYYVKQTGLLVGWYWKERWLSLKGASLTVHTRKTKVRRSLTPVSNTAHPILNEGFPTCQRDSVIDNSERGTRP
jgi:hypothetical protein